MVIEVVPAQLYALAAVLDAAAEQADRSAAAVPEDPGAGPRDPCGRGVLRHGQPPEPRDDPLWRRQRPRPRP